MTITHTDAEIAVLEQDRRLRTLHPDGKKYKIGNDHSEIKTRLDEARLVVETSQAALGAGGARSLADPEPGRTPARSRLEVD